MCKRTTRMLLRSLDACSSASDDAPTLLRRRRPSDALRGLTVGRKVHSAVRSASTAAAMRSSFSCRCCVLERSTSEWRCTGQGGTGDGASRSVPAYTYTVYDAYASSSACSP